MTPAQINARIAKFARIVEGKAEKIRQAGNDSWVPITEKGETKAVRAFLTQQGAGIDYLNRRLARFLKVDGRVVKFAGVFLHGTPKVEGWIQRSRRKTPTGICELADLQTVFLYLDSGNTIRQMRCVLFQAKRKPLKGARVVKDPEQTQLYDTCDGFCYINNSVAKKGEERRLPKNASRKRALQYLFVEPRPVIAITTPSEQGKGTTSPYGDHLFQFLKDKTGLNAGTRKSAWGKIVWELVDRAVKTLKEDQKIKGTGVKGLLKAFNNFESHKTWCIDSGASDDGFGVQLVIVWDGGIPPSEPQEDVLPKVPVKVKIVKETPKQKVAVEEAEMEVVEGRAVLVELG